MLYLKSIYTNACQVGSFCVSIIYVVCIFIHERDEADIFIHERDETELQMLKE